MRYMQDNEVAKGYLLRALNFLIEAKIITSEQGQRILDCFAADCNCLTEEEALDYYRRNFIKKL